MNFDQAIDRRSTHSLKWDEMQKYSGISPDTGLAMWVADMDFRSPPSVEKALAKMSSHGIYGYFGDYGKYLESIQWWMQTRHGWAIEADDILTTHGLVNAVGICIDAFTAPDDGVILMTPTYHAFARVIKAAGRSVVECRLETSNGKFQMPLDQWDRQMTGREKMLILCSPHNPGGRVWTLQELRDIAAFCQRHDLLLISDEIHHDLVYPGHRHIVMDNAAPDIKDRLIVMTAATKTFNLASLHTGNIIIRDASLRERLSSRMMALGISPNGFAGHLVPAVYSPAGAEWLDELMVYLDGNRTLFDEGINAIAGLTSMQLEATYLAWVDFSETGMPQQEIHRRVAEVAQIATNIGATFGAGGELHMRFNIGTQRRNIEDAIERLRRAFP
jgi:cystathionine beta-lyase